jgi:hypothetical protein
VLTGETVLSDLWTYPRITDFWEYRTKAVERGAEVLDSLEPDVRVSALQSLESAVNDYAGQLADPHLAMTGFIMLEDLYKSIVISTSWSDGLDAYLRSTARTLVDILSGRGFVLQFVISNTYPDVSVPLQVCQWWFGAAGLLVTGPQVEALAIMEHEGVPPDTNAMAPFLSEGVKLAESLVERCQEERRGYVFLNFEPTEGESLGTSFDVALRMRTKPGVIAAFRSEPPTPGTNVTLWPPEGVDFQQFPRKA